MLMKQAPRLRNMRLSSISGAVSIILCGHYKSDKDNRYPDL